MTEKDNNSFENSTDTLSYYPGVLHIRLATAYVPPQVLREMFSPPEALKKGTLFPELYRPYRPYPMKSEV